MRILGADSFIDRSTSINAIPVNYLRHGDTCIVKIDNVDPINYRAVYFYEYITNDGNDENIPYVINPLDNKDINLDTGMIGDSGSRWKLKDIFTTNLVATQIITNTITPGTSGVPITIGDDLTVHDHGVTIDGQVTVISGITEPPFIVNSDVMVDNLNAEYLGGESYQNFIKNRNNQLLIPNGVDYLDVYMTHPMINPPHYSVMIDICNLVDPDPAIYGFVITKKEPEYFRIKFSGIIDSPNYTLHYFLVGEYDNPSPSGSPPPSGAPSGSPPPSGSP